MIIEKYGFLAVDYYNRLFLVNTETEKIKLLNNYIEIYNIEDLQESSTKGVI